MIDEMKALNAGKPMEQWKLVGIPQSLCFGVHPTVNGPGSDDIVHPLCAAETISRANAAKIANSYIAEYNKVVSGLNGKLAGLRSEYLKPWLDKLADKGFATRDGYGYEGTAPIVPDMGTEFSIVGARAVFPIGPIAVTLEIQGTGGWGVGGDVTYGAQFLDASGAPKVGFKAEAGIKPFAHVDVDVFVGVGFDFGIGGASVGFGGFITLVEIQAPITGGVKLALEKKDLGTSPVETRTWPSELQPFQALGNPLKRQRVQYTWKQEGKIGAAVDFQFLKGELDVRLRVRFLFFSKTWKKRIAKLPGLQKTFAWTGTLDVPVNLPALDLPVLDPVPLPTIPEITASDLWFPDNASSMPWPSVQQFGNASIRSKVTNMGAAASLRACEPPPVL
jgi:hypothetical protein